MAFLIDQLNNSGLFAQSAYSAGIATCDSDGNVITDTYLTAHQPISANEWNSSYETVQTNSGSWAGGTVESYDLSAGNNIQITKDDVNSAIGIAVTGLNQTNWNNSYTALTSNSANWNNTRSTVQSNSASWAQGTTYTEGDGIDITNNVISLDSPIVFSAGSGLSVTMDSNTARLDVTAQGGGGGSYTGDAQGALDEVYTNSGNWNDTYTNVSTNSAGWGGDTIALSAGEGIGIDLGVSAVTISSTYGSDISYLSATIGDVESLLAQL